MDTATLLARLDHLAIETPSWGLADSGTRFIFRQAAAAKQLDEKLSDAGQVHTYTGLCPRVALHIPWDRADDWAGVRALAASHGVAIGAINPNVFQIRITSSARSATATEGCATRRSAITATASRSPRPPARRRSACGTPTAATIPVSTPSASASAACRMRSARSTSSCRRACACSSSTNSSSPPSTTPTSRTGAPPCCCARSWAPGPGAGRYRPPCPGHQHRAYRRHPAR